MAVKRNTLSFEDKNKIINLIESKCTKKEITTRFVISERSYFRIKAEITKIRSNLENNNNSKKRIRKSRYEKIDNFIVELVKECVRNTDINFPPSKAGNKSIKEINK